MTSGMISLFRSPLLEGESVYTLSNIDQGYFTEGYKKGERKPARHNVIPKVLEDGRLEWEMMDTELNRAFCESLIPTLPDPVIAYSIGYPEDEIPEGVEFEIPGDAVQVVKKGRGRPKVKADEK